MYDKRIELLKSLVIVDQHATVNMYPVPCPSHPRNWFRSKHDHPWLLCHISATKAFGDLIGAYHSGVKL